MAGTRNAPKTTETQKESTMSTMLFTPIDDEAKLADVLSGARGRGDYRTILEAFVKAGIRLAEVPLTEGLLESKNGQTVKTGFENAKSSVKNPVEGAENVKIVKKSTSTGEGDDKVTVDHIYLVNTAVEA